MHVDVYYKTAVPPIRERYGVGLDARFIGPGLYIYCTGRIAICTVHSWIDEVRHGVGRAAENRFADVRFLSCIDTRPREARWEEREETRRKQETGNRAGGRSLGTGWLNDCKSGRSGRMSRMSPLLPYPPCSLVDHAR